MLAEYETLQIFLREFASYELKLGQLEAAQRQSHGSQAAWQLCWASILDGVDGQVEIVDQLQTISLLQNSGMGFVGL